MGTYQQLTTEQVEVLEVLRDLEDFHSELYNSQQEKIDAFSWDSLDLNKPDEELILYIDMFKHFGYVDPDGTVNYDGLQYLLLHRQRERIKLEVDKKKESENQKPQLIVNVDYKNEVHNAPFSHIDFEFSPEFVAELTAFKSEIALLKGEELKPVKNIAINLIEKAIGWCTRKRG